MNGETAAGWRKSSLSEAGNCVEAASGRRKAAPGMPGGACADAAAGRGGWGAVVYVADTSEGTGFGRTVLEFTSSAWERFTGTLRGCSCACRACRDGNCWMCPNGGH
jgi:hypothetical protein